MLKEGFLVKRVSAPQPLRTRLGAGARRPPAHLSRDPAGWGPSGRSRVSWTEPGGRWLGMSFS